MGGTHYDTLGVSKDASIEDIKATFRKLSKETHPDVGGENACAEKFKRISHAASILTSPSKREAYDLQVQAPFRGSLHRQDFVKRNKSPQQRPTTNLQIFWSTVLRPRNLVLGSFAVLTTVTALNYLSGTEKKQVRNHSHKVQAWKNPKTDQCEQPAPWDPIYKKLKPKLTMVPRDQVKTRTR